MADLFGYTPPFRDIRNQRPSVSEQKAELPRELGLLIRTIPPEARDGSIQVVRLWRSRVEAAEKIARNPRSSIHDLTRAIASMQAKLVKLDAPATPRS